MKRAYKVILVAAVIVAAYIIFDEFDVRFAPRSETSITLITKTIDPLVTIEKVIEFEVRVPKEGFEFCDSPIGRFLCNNSSFAGSPEIKKLKTTVSELVPCPICAQLSNATAVIKYPAEMSYQQSAVVEVFLIPQTSNTAPADPILLQKGQRATAPTKVVSTETMQAMIASQTFTATPNRTQDRTVLVDRTSWWKWEVTPMVYGEDQKLEIQIFAIPQVNGKLVSPLSPSSIEIPIPIRATLLQRAYEAAPQIDAFRSMIAAIGAVALGAVSWVISKIWPKKSGDVLDLVETQRREADKSREHHGGDDLKDSA